MRRQVLNLSVSLFVLALMASGPTALAMSPRTTMHDQEETETTVSTTESENSEVENPTDARASDSRLGAAKLKACQNRQNAINTIMKRVNTRAQNQLTLFNGIATRVENFYTTKGKTVSNYDELTSAIANAKAKAEADLNTLQGGSTFSCTSDNPKATVTAFKSYAKTEITDLQNYRTAVKNLIIAVAHANGVTVSSSSQTDTQGDQ